jgi:uncharacterized protein (DUF1800 family)
MPMSRRVVARRRHPSHGRLHRLHRPAVTGVTNPTLSPAMVERLFWRAGFGATAGDRAAWTGKKVTALVDHLLAAPETLIGPPPQNNGSPLDPTSNDTDLVLDWVDRMVRTTNPFVERLTFFLHRHFANARDGGPSQQMLMRQIAMFRRYATSPAASFRTLLREVTIDPSMLRYLTGEQNAPPDSNENYAREVMELFTLGILDDTGALNYTQGDIGHLAKAFTGWQIDESNPDAPVAYFTRSRWSNGPKRPFGYTQNYQAYPLGDPTYQASRDACEIVLQRPVRIDGEPDNRHRKPYVTHARFFLRKLWHEFIVAEPDPATLQDLVNSYLAPGPGGTPGLLLRPVLRKILSNPLIFESLSEPNMVKPPIVYVVGVMRSLGVGVVDDTASQYLDAMGQTPYNPPNVSGWEGGVSWLNTNTVLSRFSLAGDLMRGAAAPQDQAGETGRSAVTRALAAVANPWLANASLGVLYDYAGRASSSSSSDRIERQRLLRSLALCGPDGQVM